MNLLLYIYTYKLSYIVMHAFFSTFFIFCLQDNGTVSGWVVTSALPWTVLVVAVEPISGVMVSVSMSALKIIGGDEVVLTFHRSPLFPPQLLSPVLCMLVLMVFCQLFCLLVITSHLFS